MTEPRIRGAALAVLLIAGFGAAASASGQEVSPEQAARSRYALGLEFMARGQRDEALQDFRGIVKQFPTSSVADNALLQIALHAMDILHDLDAAQTAAETVIRTYGDRDAAPMAHIVLARVALARGVTPEYLDAALASYERVVTLFPWDLDSAPLALYGRAEALRVAGRADEAVEAYERLSMEYPRSRWAAAGRLGLARCLARAGEFGRALFELQRVRLRFPGTRESDEALGWSSIVRRLHPLAAGSRPAFQFVPPRAPGPETKRVVALAFGPRGALHAVTSDGISILDAAGAVTGTVPSVNARDVIFGASGQPVVVRDDGLQAGRGGLLRVTAAGSARPLQDIVAAAVTPDGDLLIADKGRKVIARFAGGAWRVFTGNGSDPLGPGATFAVVAASRLAVDSLGNVAALDADARSVVIVDRGGQPVGRVASRGSGYELRQPVDLAYDAMDHLYVLDRDAASVLVFDPGLNLLSTFTLAEDAPGAFRRPRALAVDGAGRLYVYDERVERVQAYR